MSLLRILVALAWAWAAWADVADCACDPAKPETMKARECGLCREAEKQPPEVKIFFLKDTNPRKPNRWLALPREHITGGHHLDEMPDQDRIALWTAAIEKAGQLWGNEWGVAYNGELVRTQCHAHVHIGKLLKGVCSGKILTVGGPAQIPKHPRKGLWIHPAGKKLHVHLEEGITETALVR
jgi:hypothetical protein